MTMKKVELKDAVALIFTIHGWGNRKSIDSKKIKTNANKKMVHLTKRLIDPKGEVQDIERFMNTFVKGWIVKKSVPSFFREGVYLFNISMVSEVETFLQDSARKLDELVQKLLDAYPQRIKEVEEMLGEYYDRKDYPTTSELRYKFRFSWQWVEFGIPKTLPDDLFKAEKKKVEAMWAEAAEQITFSLREGFRKLISHAVEVLEVGKDGKTKAFRDSSFENVSEFIDSFKNRNLTNDTELAMLVEKARKVMTGLDDPQELKRDADMRKAVEKGFTDIEKKLDKLVEVKPKRKFTFEE